MKNSIYNQLIIPDENRYASITRDEAEYINSFLKENKLTSTIEIGFGYGCSAAHIIEATRSYHYVIDPFPELFDNLGEKNICALGFDNFLIWEKGFSHDVLPRLLGEGKKFDFIFIDGGHKFDSIFLDYYYADLLLNQRGYVLFHDTWMKSTQMVCSWIKTNKPYYSKIKTRCANFALFQKNGADTREWDHFREFYVCGHTLITFMKKTIFRIMSMCKNENK
jgi:predicted O-methyltransferase YrrM